MLVGAALSSHASLTTTQAAVYAVHQGHLVELLRDTTPGTPPSWVNLGEPVGTCVAYPPTMVWAGDSAAPIRVFCTTSSGELAARLLDFNTRAPLSWERHVNGGPPAVFTPPGASVEWSVTARFGCLAAFLPVPPVRVGRTSLFVGATDGSLWERTRIGGAFQWISHGNPPGTCVVGEPMTDPALVPPASPLRIFAATAAGTLFERIIDGPSGVTWIDHGRPSSAAGPLNVGSGGVVVADLEQGAVHVLITTGETLHRLSIPTLGSPGTWTALPLPAPTIPSESTWVATNPASGTTIVGDGTVVGEFFVVATRRRSTGSLVSAPTEEVWHCRTDVRKPGDLTWATNLGAPGRPAPAGVDYYVINVVRGLAAAPLSRVYASSRPAQGTLESLDEWTFAPAGTATGLGLPPVMPAPCSSPPPVMRTCGGPRQFGVGAGG